MPPQFRALTAIFVFPKHIQQHKELNVCLCTVYLDSMNGNTYPWFIHIWCIYISSRLTLLLYIVCLEVHESKGKIVSRKTRRLYWKLKPSQGKHCVMRMKLYPMKGYPHESSFCMTDLLFVLCGEVSIFGKHSFWLWFYELILIIVPYWFR